MADDPMLTALKRVAVLLKRGSVPFALAGSYASFARGGNPSEHDVDFVLKEHDVNRVTTILGDAGIKVEHPPEDWLVKAYTDGCLVDLIYELPMGPVDDDLLERATVLEVASVDLPVLAATDLVTAKLLALSEHWCDLSPVLRMVRTLREQVDWDSVREAVQGSPFARGFLVVADGLGITDVLPQAEAKEAV